MENYYIEATEDNSFTSPTVNLNAETGVCEMTGESFMNNSHEFYTPIINWFTEYSSDSSRKINFIIKIDYYNTSSSKALFEILDTLKSFENKGGELYIEWHFDNEDSEMEDDITDLAISAGVDITLVGYN